MEPTGQMANPGKIRHLRGNLRWPTAAEKILAGRAHDVFSHESGVREGIDPEAIHDIRVALRRLQAALRMFAACYPPKRLKRYRLRLRKLLQTLGAERDQDIMIATLSNHAESAPAPVRQAMARLVAQRRTAKQQHRARSLRLLDKLQGADFAKNLSSFIRGARGFQRANPHAHLAPGLAAIRQRAITAWNDHREQVRGRDDPEMLHQMRIAVKRLRYTLELCRFENGYDYQGCLDRLAEMQRVLGDLHDADILMQFLAESLPQAPAEAIAGLADIVRKTKQKRQDLAKRFLSMIGDRHLGPLRPARRPG
ncbi:MAG: CHAD domain-containing protein, partial [Candidatus Methylomirabilaceae bacterium]